MYFPIGWPKALNLSLAAADDAVIRHVCCDAVKILVAAISNETLSIWYLNPLMPISYHQRAKTSIDLYGGNKHIIWKPDSREIAILTDLGVIILYRVQLIQDGASILQQVDPPKLKRQRESSELFVKENIPQLQLTEHAVYQQNAPITVISCISLTELLIATTQCELIRLLWTDLELYANDKEASEPAASTTTTTINKINLKSIPFYVKQVSSFKSQPTVGDQSFIAELEYSPFIGGCAAIFSDKRAAVLIADHLRFEASSMHGFWLPDVDDAVACSVNHKFRLVAYGRAQGDVVVFAIDDSTGGLEYSHALNMDACMVPQAKLAAVSDLRWSPDGCVLAVTWDYCGIALWSTFGTLLMSSFDWDFGLYADVLLKNPLAISKLEWSTEGYQLFLICKSQQTNVLQLSFVKSVLTTNPCMTSQPHVLLQGDDTLYFNQGGNLERIYKGLSVAFPNSKNNTQKNESVQMAGGSGGIDLEMVRGGGNSFNILAECKHWATLQLPLTYAATNWPIRYSAVDSSGHNLVVAGRTGLAHYSMLTRKWKVFGNETQEKDFVVSGGMTYWQDYIILGCYSLIDQTDEIRCYPFKKKLDNEYAKRIHVRAPIITLNICQQQLIILTADGIVSLYVLSVAVDGGHSSNGHNGNEAISVECAYELDVKNICIHPACIVSLTVTHLRNDAAGNVQQQQPMYDEYLSEAIIVNVSGRILMIQRDLQNSIISSMMASCLASCVECFWTSTDVLKSPMHESLWLYSGLHGMRVWLPILPPTHKQQYQQTQHMHSFMSKRIMLSFPLKLYPLVILFDNVIALGVENETTLYSSELYSYFSLPYCLIELKSQVYLHKILRQLIKRNLGYSAWEIAKSCRALPYFAHSLELLLHEVLEDEATSKEPIPDALLPGILNFIREFPAYLKTVVQCARKTEIALWPYLFSVAGKPKDLFQQCLQLAQLDTAAGFLVILQNLEPSFISKQYAAELLDVALKNFKWELAKELIRFLKAIDPHEVDSPRSSVAINLKIAPHAHAAKSQVDTNAEAFNMILGPISRERSFSATTAPLLTTKKREDKSTTAQAIATTNIKTSSSSAAASSSNQASELKLSVSPGTTSAMSSTATNAATITTTKSQIQKRQRHDSAGASGGAGHAAAAAALEVEKRKSIFCIDSVLQAHARTLLQNYKLLQLGYMSAYLDYHLVSWLSHEAGAAARLDDFVVALKCLHKEFNLSGTEALLLDIQADEGVNCAAASTANNNDIAATAISSHIDDTKSVTTESGYFSLARLDTPVSEKNQNEENGNKLSNEQQQQCFNYDDYHSLDLNQFATSQIEMLPPQHELTTSKLPEKLAIKIRYLLQLFIEANCIDFALVLSILLNDGGSIGRIINGIMRTESTAFCCRIESGLKRLLQWSLKKDCSYRPFMLSLRPHILLLEQYLLQSSQNSTFAGNLALQRSLSTQSADEARRDSNQNHSQQFSYDDDGCMINDVDADDWAYDKNDAKQPPYHHHHLHLNQLTQDMFAHQKRSSLASIAEDAATPTKAKNNCRVM